MKNTLIQTFIGKLIFNLLLLISIASCNKDNCEYKTKFSCKTGIDVAFLIDYSSAMNTQRDSLKNQINNIVNKIDVLSGGDYQLSLSIFDETYKSHILLYTTEPVYMNLPAAQKKTITTGPTLRQYLTVLETFSLNNKASFSSKLANLDILGTMRTGAGVGAPDPGGLLLNEILEPKTFAGTWRPNVKKLTIIFTDSPAGGDDDLADSVDESYLSSLATAANPSASASGTQILLVTSLATSNYETHLINNNVGGLKLMNVDFNNVENDIVDLLENYCTNN